MLYLTPKLKINDSEHSEGVQQDFEPCPDLLGSCDQKTMQLKAGF